MMSGQSLQIKKKKKETKHWGNVLKDVFQIQCESLRAGGSWNVCN